MTDEGDDEVEPVEGIDEMDGTVTRGGDVGGVGLVFGGGRLGREAKLLLSAMAVKSDANWSSSVLVGVLEKSGRGGSANDVQCILREDWLECEGKVFDVTCLFFRKIRDYLLQHRRVPARNTL